MEAMWPQYSTAVAGWRGRRSFWGGAAMTDQAHVVASTGADRGGEAPPRPAIQVVPVKGLPIVAAIVVFLIVAITKNWRWALDWYHVAGGGLWAGIDLFVGLVLGPILGWVSSAARGACTARCRAKIGPSPRRLGVMRLAAGFAPSVN